VLDGLGGPDSAPGSASGDAILERRDGCTEESFTELVTALAPVAAGALDEVDLGQGT
jgi:hypothetical protein